MDGIVYVAVDDRGPAYLRPNWNGQWHGPGGCVTPALRQKSFVSHRNWIGHCEYNQCRCGHRRDCRRNQSADPNSNCRISLTRGAGDPRAANLGLLSSDCQNVQVADAGALRLCRLGGVCPARLERGAQGDIHSQTQFRLEFFGDGGGDLWDHDLAVSFFLASRSGGRRRDQLRSGDSRAAPRRLRRRDQICEMGRSYWNVSVELGDVFHYSGDRGDSI